MKIESITAQQTREFSNLVIDKTKGDLMALQVEMDVLYKSWEERNVLSQTLYDKGLSIFKIPKDDELSVKEAKWASDTRRAFWDKHEKDVEFGKDLKLKFRSSVLFLYMFYNFLPYNKRVYFKEVDGDNIREQIALFVMAHSHNRHMFHKTQDWDQMRWFGFVWKKGWHYNDIDYGS